MKKKKIITLALASLAVLSISALIFISIMKKHTQTFINLTNEEKMEDFDFLLALLDDSYPFWKDAEDMGIEKGKLIGEYRSFVNKTSTDIDFIKEIGYFLKEFKGLGHLLLLDGYNYRFYNETFDLGEEKYFSESKMKELQPWYDVLRNSQSRETYSMLDQNRKGIRSTIAMKKKYSEQAEGADGADNKSDDSGKNLEFRIIDNDTAYINIKSFFLQHIENDSRVLPDYYGKAAGCRNLIIDIRENRGGSDNYWKELLVSPNISEPLSAQRYFLFNENDWTSPFIRANFDESQVFSIGELPDLENLDHSVKSRLTNYLIDHTTIEPSGTSGFNGRIWVLTSETVYSAAENFVMFCKNSGFATLVGTNTNGDGGVLDPILIALPNSGLLIRFSMLYGLNSDGSGNEAYGTSPHIAKEENEDALDLCLDQIK